MNIFCICGSENYKKIFSGQCQNNHYSVIRCQQCGLARTYPKPLEGENNYEFYNDQKDYYERVDELNLWKNFAKKTLKILKKYKSSGKLLDIGCNVGIFVHQANKKGYDSMGIDLSSKALEYGVKKFELSNRLFNGKLKDLNFPSNHFDIITCIHVLEHIEKVDNELKEVYKILKPDGILLIEVPNFGSIWRKVLGAKWYGLIPSQHIWQFERSSLIRILKDQKFSILLASGKYNLDHKISLDFKGLIKLLLLFIAYIFRLGDNLVIVATKYE